MNSPFASHVQIGPRRIGPDQPCFIIAEAGVNHNGSEQAAMQLIDAAVAAGADAVKFQTFSADRLAAAGAPKAEYQIETTGGAESQHQMLKRLELPDDAQQRLRWHCDERGIIFLSTPFDEDSADFLERLDVAAFKISSGDLTNLPLLQHVAAKKRPMLVSTGMADAGEVAAAVSALARSGLRELVLLHCVSSYPAPPADANLRAMQSMARAHQVPVGYSDHTNGLEVALAAVALGACVIEKHYTLDRNLPGPDHAASLEPDELVALVAGVRKVESALGDGIKQARACEFAVAAVARKSLHWAHPLAAGSVIGSQDLLALRPGTGISPAERDALVGSRTSRPVAAGEMAKREDFEPVR